MVRSSPGVGMNKHREFHDGRQDGLVPLESLDLDEVTSFASLPVASTVMVAPGPAPSIMSPMIEVPPTTSCPRLTFTSASNFSTICTNFADARACNPLLLQISSTRVTAVPSPA